ncbi:MAG: hypothetical protein Aurels2KO_47820 [Aureliella sp.]
MRLLTILLALFSIVTVLNTSNAQQTAQFREAPPLPDEQQLPLEMHSQMEDVPKISVGRTDADLVGTDNRVLQAAVDYIAGLGGGVVEVGPGEYLMRDSLHLRSGVTVQGVEGKTILRKHDAAVSTLAIDGDYGEQQITMSSPKGFAVGHGVAVWDNRSGGFHTTVARITGQSGSRFAIDKPLNADCMVQNNAKAATVFPVVSGYNVRNSRLIGLTIHGNKENNPHLNGCRGGGIFFYRGHGAVIENCTVDGYNGDGVSFQQSNDVVVFGCNSLNSSQLGFHPGSGSQRATVRDCVATNNGTDGLFLCWRVRHGVFENNLLEGNKRFGISIGHKDSDNLIRKNRVRKNGEDGVYFRDETYGMAAHRNRVVDNVIEDNGASGSGAGIRIRGQTDGLVISNNTIRDNQDSPTQTIGVLIEQQVLTVNLNGNKIQATHKVKDERKRQVDVKK